MATAVATQSFRLPKKTSQSPLAGLAGPNQVPLPDLQATIRKEQSQATRNIARTPVNSFTFEAITGNYISKSIEYEKSGKKNTFATTTVSVTPQNLVKLANEHPHSKLYKLNANKTGTHFSFFLVQEKIYTRNSFYSRN